MRIALAIEIGWRQHSERGSPVWLVELAALGEPALLTATIAEALGLRSEGGPHELAQLVTQLREQSLLLILDNCEHLLGACAVVVAALLAGCPGVRVLATSRQALRIPGERPWLVPALSLPPNSG